MLTLTLCFISLASISNAYLESGWYKIVCRQPSPHNPKAQYLSLWNHRTHEVALREDTDAITGWGLSVWYIRRLSTGYRIQSSTLRVSHSWMRLLNGAYLRVWDNAHVFDWTLEFVESELQRNYYKMRVVVNGQPRYAAVRNGDGHVEVVTQRTHSGHWGYVTRSFYFQKVSWDKWTSIPPHAFLKPVSYQAVLARGSNNLPTLVEPRYPFRDNVWFTNKQQGEIEFTFRIGDDYRLLCDDATGRVNMYTFNYYCHWYLVWAGGSPGRLRFRLKNRVSQRYLGVENNRVVTRLYWEIPQFTMGWIWEFVPRPLHHLPNLSVYRMFRYSSGADITRPLLTVVYPYYHPSSYITVYPESSTRNDLHNFKFRQVGRDGRNPGYAVDRLWFWLGNTKYPAHALYFEFVKEDAHGNPAFLIYVWKGSALVFCGGSKVLCVGGYSTSATSFPDHYLFTLVPTDIFVLKREWISGVQSEVLGVQKSPPPRCSNNWAHTDATRELSIDVTVETGSYTEVTHGATVGVAVSTSITVGAEVGFLGTGASVEWSIGIELSSEYSYSKMSGTSKSKSETISEGMSLTIPPNHRGCIQMQYGTILYSRKWMLEYQVRETGATIRTYGTQTRKDFGWTLNALPHTRL